MPQVIFYQLADDKPSAVHEKACDLVAEAYGNKQRCVVLCASQKDAESIDELLWQLPSQRFVPHNLAGEGPAGGAPVEIHWQDAGLPKKPCLVNLSEALPANVRQHQRIIDFVPVAEEAKKAARQRYKQYQQAGCSMQFIAG